MANSQYVFDPDRCDVPRLPRLPRIPLVQDCELPEVPAPIFQCPNSPPELPPLPDLPPGGGGGPPGDDCRVPVMQTVCNTDNHDITDGPLPIRVISVNKAASLRLWSTENQFCPGQYNVIIDIGGGPSDSVFWQGVGGVPPRWTQCPKIGHSVEIGTIEQPGWLIQQGHGGTFAMAPGNQTDQKWRLPNELPEDISGYLMVDAFDGNCLQLAWSPPGATGLIITYTGQRVQVERGLIVEITPGGTFPANSGEAECEITPCVPFDPCA